MSLIKKIFQKEVGGESNYEITPSVGDVMLDIAYTAIILGSIWCLMNPDKVSDFVSDRFSSLQVEPQDAKMSSVQTPRLG